MSSPELQASPPQRVTDDLDRLLAVLPEAVAQTLAAEPVRDALLEVVLISNEIKVA